MGSKIKFAIYVIIIFFLASFGVKNSQTVQLKYYFDFLNIEMPLYGLIFISILIGIALGIFLWDLSVISTSVKRLKPWSGKIKN